MNEQEFWAALTPVAPPAVFYRLYYNEQGYPLFYSMEDAPGNYIEIDKETYRSASSYVRVVNGKLITIDISQVSKLKPGDTGTACDPRNVSVVVDETQPHIKWSLK